MAADERRVRGFWGEPLGWDKPVITWMVSCGVVENVRHFVISARSAGCERADLGIFLRVELIMEV